MILKNHTPHPFVIASVLLSPSHITMESALWHHGLIPEGVSEVVCGTPKRARRFHTPVGLFNFIRIPDLNPRAGVRA